MSCCAAGPCDRYLDAGRMMGAWPQLEVRRRLYRACAVCFWGDPRYKAQPETLIDRMARLEREAEEVATAKEDGRKEPQFEEFAPEEHYGVQAELVDRVRTDPTKRARSRKGPFYVPASAWVAPR